MRELQQREYLREALPGLLVALMCFSCVLFLIVFQFAQSGSTFQATPLRQISKDTSSSDLEYRKQRLIQAWRRLMLRSKQQSRSIRLSKNSTPTSWLSVGSPKAPGSEASVACGFTSIEEQIAQSFISVQPLT
ncbi:MAG: hypothetical protein GYA55_14130 [SAR324 cluster bacterium]|uniref:Uncharacterized protein n=1 Tax=SAR324 cluster bacterium TaxID=2024889 RepID=A0A7X9FU14_9DELT|nr:hypothetical protein [SAR324 cluster bacterium]